MNYLVLKDANKEQVLSTRIIKEPKTALAILQPMRWKLMEEMSEDACCAKELARKLGTSEQVICYHLKELQRLGLIRLERVAKRRGATAKFYKSEQKALTVIPPSCSNMGNRQEDVNGGLYPTIIGPFVTDGHLNGTIVVGSPDPHGVFKSRARDAHRAVDLALFFGAFLRVTKDLVVRLDTEVTQYDLTRSMILVGGPKANNITLLVNDWLPITYELAGQNMMMSRISGRTYTGEEEGTMQLVNNPMNEETKVLVLAGNTYLGTRAAVLGFIKYTDEFASGNTFNRSICSRVVSGVDIDSDGLIDDVQFLE